MNKLIPLLCATPGGWLGWRLGAHIGIMSAYFVSLLGTGVGWYLGILLLKRYRP